MAKTLPITSITVTINGNDYSNHVMFPFKVSNLLDEQLDEASLTLIGVSEKNFKPLTDVTVTLTNGNKTQSYHMLVASDKSDEIPTGSGKYKHELYLIEQTKYLECFIVRSIGFVDTLSESHTRINTIFNTLDVSYSQMYMQNIYGTIDQFQELMKSPIYENQEYYVPSASSLVSEWESSVFPHDSGLYTFNRLTYGETTIVNNGVKTVYKEELWDKPLYYFKPQAGVCDITIKANVVVYNTDRPPTEGVTPPTDATIFVDRASITCRLYLSVVPPISKNLKWNARTVIRRALIVAETLLQGEIPRFKLDRDVPYYDANGNQIEFLGDFDSLADLQTAYPSNIGDLAWVVNATSSGGGTYRYSANGWIIKNEEYPLTGQALELQKIETPEFQFTQSTLREILQSVGKFIHAEPRLINGDTITFDKLGSGDISNFSDTNYASKNYQQAVDRYATNLYSTVDNFVNSINYANGVIVEPYSNGYKTVRTEDVFVKVEDTNIFIDTKYPIRAIHSLKCGYADGYEDVANVILDAELEPFVYESAEYKRLSSYDGAYPMSKAWALYYTIGQKGIHGLNFKPQSALLQAFQNYAIVNILNAVSGKPQLNTDMRQLAFRVTYEPIYSATAQQNKSYIGDIDKPASLVYNQGQNLIESHYYGENLKGAIARLGNVDKVLTYVKHGLVEPPKVGQILMEGDDEYYISAVATEIQPYYTKFSMSLSKDFNRYSDYVGVDSQKRMYEVSERQAFDSHITYKDYVVIGDMVYNENAIDDGLVKFEFMEEIFTPYTNRSVSLAELQGYDIGGNALQKVALPIQKSAIGNSALFTIKYQDNYSAGDDFIPNNNIYWQNGVAYSDYFGNVESLEMTLRKDGASPTNYAEQSEIGNALPLYNFDEDSDDQWISTKNTNKRLWIKKGSTEIPTIDYQIDFVTNRSDIIIGSALAKNLPLICGDLGAEHNAKLYLLKNRLNKFNKVVDISNADEHTFSLSLVDNYYLFIDEGISEEYKSWAIVDGSTNELLIGCNRTITSAEGVFNGLKMFIKHDIYKDKI